MNVSTTMNLKIVRSILFGIIACGIMLTLLSNARPAAANHAATPSATCEPDRTQTSGARYRICMPSIWFSNDVVIYAHGYVTPSAPLTIPVESDALANALTSFGYAFATTSFSTNGLAIKQGVADVIDLINIFKSEHPTAKHVLLVGFSEGGLVTTLATEQYPNLINGGLAACGPIGDFQKQVDYFGDFRVAFDYFFPSLMPGSPISITPSLMNNFELTFTTVISSALLNPSNAISVTQLFSVTGAPTDASAYSASVLTTTHDLLWYNVYATNDAIAKLGGQPFDNSTRTYTGSLNDAALNANIERFSADVSARNEIQAYYQTSGVLQSPLVTLHTTGDQVVPYWHEALYRAKVASHGRLPRLDQITVARYGHCNFTLSEVQSAFTLLVSRVNNPQPFLQFLPLIKR